MSNTTFTTWVEATPEEKAAEERHKQRNSHRYSNFSTGNGGFSYSLHDPEPASSPPVEPVNEAPGYDTAAVEAAGEWDEDDDDIDVSEDEEEPVRGWSHSVFLPFDLNIKALSKQLKEIAIEERVALEVKDSELVISADTQEELEAGRVKVDQLIFLRHRPQIAPAKVKRIPKPERPGEWGQPRQECVTDDKYNLLGNY